MVKAGEYNKLAVQRFTQFGAFLEDGKGWIFCCLTRFVPRNAPREGDVLEVFVYHDSEDRHDCNYAKAKSGCWRNCDVAGCYRYQPGCVFRLGT